MKSALDWLNGRPTSPASRIEPHVTCGGLLLLRDLGDAVRGDPKALDDELPFLSPPPNTRARRSPSGLGAGEDKLLHPAPILDLSGVEIALAVGGDMVHTSKFARLHASLSE